MYKTSDENSHTNSRFYKNCRFYINLFIDPAGNAFCGKALNVSKASVKYIQNLKLDTDIFQNNFIHKAQIVQVDEFVQHINGK